MTVPPSITTVAPVMPSAVGADEQLDGGGHVGRRRAQVAERGFGDERVGRQAFRGATTPSAPRRSSR